jgi:hypothetical protein
LGKIFQEEKIMKKTIILTLIIVLVFSTQPALGYESSDCLSCHKGSGASGDYLYLEPFIYFNVPLIVKPNSTFNFEVGFEFSDYELLDVDINITQEPQVLLFNGSMDIKRNHINGGEIFNFSATAVGVGICNIIAKISYTIFFEHTTEKESDFREETVSEKAMVIVGSLSLAPSLWTVNMENGRSGFTLLASQDVFNLTVLPPDNVMATPTQFPEVFTGEMVYIGLAADFDKGSNENINYPLIISWEESNSSYVASIKVVYNPEIEEETNYVPLMGRVFGILSYIILWISVLSGGSVPRFRTFLNKRLGNRMRKNVHCALSWILLATALYHGLILVSGAYYQVAWDDIIILGWFAFISMFIAGIVGIFMRKIVKQIGIKKWKVLNIVLSAIAIILITYHMIIIGTDLAFVRALF